MKIENMLVSDIIPYMNNAKEHPKHQIEQIVNSIREFGFNDPIAIDEHNVIIEGHGRLEALKLMGINTVDCIRLSHLTEDEHIKLIRDGVEYSYNDIMDGK
jgi:ParB-like chromosome segregation protein Spo0J